MRVNVLSKKSHHQTQGHQKELSRGTHKTQFQGNDS